MDYKISKVATQWWIDQMIKHCLELYPDKIIRKNSNLVIVDHSLQRELSHFQEVLFEEIHYHVKLYGYLSLTCCYWPVGDLGRLVKKISISKDYFPPRANMLIYNGSIEVSLDGEDLRKLPLPAKLL